MEHSTTGRQPSEDRKSASVLTCQPQHFLQGSTARLVQLSPTLHRVTTCTTPYSDTMPQQSLVTPPGSSLITSCMAQSMMQCQHNMSEPGASNRVIDHYPKASHWLLLDVYNKSPMATCVMPVTCCFLYQTLQSRCGFLWLQSMSITKSFPLFPLILLAPVSPVRHAERVQLNNCKMQSVLRREIVDEYIPFSTYSTKWSSCSTKAKIRMKHCWIHWKVFLLIFKAIICFNCHLLCKHNTPLNLTLYIYI